MLFQKENISERRPRVKRTLSFSVAKAARMAQDGPVNTASQDLAHHLDVLRQKLQHATDYELALSYFLEEFAGDAPFIQQCEPEEAPHLLAVLAHVAKAALGKPAALEQVRVFRL